MQALDAHRAVLFNAGLLVEDAGKALQACLPRLGMLAWEVRAAFPQAGSADVQALAERALRQAGAESALAAVLASLLSKQAAPDGRMPPFA